MFFKKKPVDIRIGWAYCSKCGCPMVELLDRGRKEFDISTGIGHLVSEIYWVCSKSTRWDGYEKIANKYHDSSYNKRNGLLGIDKTPIESECK